MTDADDDDRRRRSVETTKKNAAGTSSGAVKRDDGDNTRRKNRDEVIVLDEEEDDGSDDDASTTSSSSDRYQANDSSKTFAAYASVRGVYETLEKRRPKLFLRRNLSYLTRQRRRKGGSSVGNDDDSGGDVEYAYDGTNSRVMLSGNYACVMCGRNQGSFRALMTHLQASHDLCEYGGTRTKTKTEVRVFRKDMNYDGRGVLRMREADMMTCAVDREFRYVKCWGIYTERVGCAENDAEDEEEVEEDKEEGEAKWRDIRPADRYGEPVAVVREIVKAEVRREFSMGASTIDLVDLTEDASPGRAPTASPPRAPSPEPSPEPSPVPNPSPQKSPAVADQPQVLVPLPWLKLKYSPTGNVVHGAVAIEPPTTTTTTTTTTTATSAGGPSPLRTKLKEAFEALSNSRSALIKGFDPTSWIVNHLKRPTERIIASTEPPAVLPTSMTTREENILPPPSPPVNQNKRKATDEELSATRTPNNEDAERPTGKRPKHEIISKGPFFRSKTWVQMNGRPKYDSDDEDTVEARCVEAKRFLNEFIDFSQDELDFMAEWNDVAIKFNVLADYEAPALCEAFVRENGDRLREDDLFHRHFVETIINLFENGVIHKREVTEILALTKRDEPLEKWSDRVDTRGGNKRRCTLVAMKEFPQPARDTLATARYLT
jgi:hypothetical protein